MDSVWGGGRRQVIGIKNKGKKSNKIKEGGGFVVANYNIVPWMEGTQLCTWIPMYENPLSLIYLPIKHHCVCDKRHYRNA